MTEEVRCVDEIDRKYKEERKENPSQSVTRSHVIERSVGII